MNKIYVVTAGEYDDYTILATYSTKIKAEEFKTAQLKLEPWRECVWVEEWELNSVPIPNVKTQWSGYIALASKAKIDSYECMTWQPLAKGQIYNTTKENVDTTYDETEIKIIPQKYIFATSFIGEEHLKSILLKSFQEYLKKEQDSGIIYG